MSKNILSLDELSIYKKYMMMSDDTLPKKNCSKYLTNKIQQRGGADEDYIKLRKLMDEITDDVVRINGRSSEEISKVETDMKQLGTALGQLDDRSLELLRIYKEKDVETEITAEYIKEKQNELDQCQDKIEKYERMIVKGREKLEEFTNKYNEEKKKQTNYDAQNKILSEENNRLKTVNDTLSMENKTLSAEHKKLLEEKNKLKKDLSKCEEELTKSRYSQNTLRDATGQKTEIPWHFKQFERIIKEGEIKEGEIKEGKIKEGGLEKIRKEKERRAEEKRQKFEREKKENLANINKNIKDVRQPVPTLASLIGDPFKPVDQSKKISLEKSNF